MLLRSREKKGMIFELSSVRTRDFESCSNIYFPLVQAAQK